VNDEDASNGRPAYQRIADDLRAAIASGGLRPGDKLPSERELAQRYSTANMTARQAIGILKAEGLVSSRQGRGSFVRPKPPLRRLSSDRYSRRRRLEGKTPFMVDTEAVGSPTFEMLRFGPAPASGDVATRLAIQEGKLVLLTTLRFHAGTQIMQMSTAYIPFALVEASPLVNPATRPWDTDTISNLETVGVHVDEVIEETIARPATPSEIRDLQLRPGSHVFLMARTMLAGGRPVETCDIVMPTDRYLLSYRFPVDADDKAGES
jgi:GntR family transcriptional regulator